MPISFPEPALQEMELWYNPFKEPVGLAALLTGSKQITAERFDIFACRIEVTNKMAEKRQQRPQTTPKLKSVGPVTKL